MNEEKLQNQHKKIHFLQEFEKIKIEAQKDHNRKDSTIQDIYQKDLIASQYTYYQDVIKQKVFDLIKTKNQTNLLFYASNMPQKKHLNILYLYMIRELDNEFKIIQDQNYVNFYIIFKKNCNKQSTLIKFIKKLQKKLPLNYIDQIQQIYFINSGFIIKTYFLFSKIFGLSLKIKKHFIKFYYFYISKKSQLQNLIDPEILQSLKIDSYFENNQITQQNFQKNLDDYQLYDDVPVILLALTNYFDLYPENYQYKGIFRANGLKEKEDQLKQQILNEDYECIAQCDDPNIVSSFQIIIQALIKTFLIELKNPLIPFKYYQQFTNIDDIEDQVEYIKNSVQSFPEVNRKTTQFLFYFLLKFTQYSEINLMTNDNLAILITPCIFKPEKEDILTELSHIKLLIEVTKLFLNYHDCIFNNLAYQDFGLSQSF